MEDDVPRLTYEPLLYSDRDSTGRDLGSNDERVVARALLAASFEDPEPTWVFDQCLAMVHDLRVGVRWAVALAIGYLAVPGDFVDELRAREALATLGADPVVQPAASGALEDVEHALAIRPPMDFLEAVTIGGRSTLPDGRRRVVTVMEVWRSRVVIRWVEQSPIDWIERMRSPDWINGWSLTDDVGTAYDAPLTDASGTPTTLQGALRFRPSPPKHASLLVLRSPEGDATEIPWDREL